MNRLFITLILSLAVFTASSQRIYFIYLQTDPQQAFFVKMNEKLYSSTATGYIVLPRLKDSTYVFSIGFNGGGEYKFACTVNKKDHGYLVKNFGEKGWGLYDLQTSAVQMAEINEKKGTAMVNTPVNAFTELLSKAADDSTLKQKITLPAEEKQTTAPAVAVKNETVTTPAIEKAATRDTANTVGMTQTKEEVKKNAAKTADTVASKGVEGKAAADESKITGTPAVNMVNAPLTDGEPQKKIQENTESKIKEPSLSTAESYSKSKIVRKSESSTTEGFGLTYIDSYPDGRQDTINLIIPNDNAVKLADTKVEEARTATSQGSITVPDAEKETVKPVAKNACRATATDDDFFRLRKKMASAKSDNGMIQEAGKVFRSKCFTTSQLKNLSTLFIGDGGKYQFFDAAFAHVADIENFSSLGSELKDEYFVKRFNAILK